jgi:hypothetical protein
VTADEAVMTVIDSLEELGIPYFLSGSFASNYYGVPRATQDADFVVAVQRGDMDWAYIEGWADRHGTRALLDEIRASVPPI